MTREEIASKLLVYFPKSFINHNGEFIAHKKSNTYMLLGNKETWQDVAVGMLEWFSRAAYKTQCYKSAAADAKFHRFMLDGINKFLAPAKPLTNKDMELVYTYLGNGVHHALAVEFVESDCNMEILLAYAKAKDPEFAARWESQEGTA